MNKRLITIIAAAVSAAGVFFYWSLAGDARPDIGKLESYALEVLSARGMTEDKVVSRSDEFRGKGLARWKTVSYIFNSGALFFGKGLEDDLRKCAESVRGVRLGKTEYAAGKDGRGTVKYVFLRGGEKVLSLCFKEVSAEWVKTAAMPAAGDVKKVRVSQPPGKGKVKPRVAIVLDDFGYTKKNLGDLKAAGIPVTLAVMPNTPYSKAVSDFAKANGMEVILHLPMEPQNPNEKLEKDTVKVSMKGPEIKGIVDRALKSVPSAKGISNHMGSKATSDTAVMKIILGDVKKRNMYFLDSMTTEEPVSQAIAAETGVPLAQRDIFIDHRNDETSIKTQMDKVEKMALEGASIVAIGHDRPMTVKVLKEYAPKMKKKGITFVLISELIEQQKD